MNSIDFPWGTIVKEHTIGDHTIIEFIVGDTWEDAGAINFHTDTCNGASFDTLDEALLGCLCAKYQPEDDTLFEYAARMIPGLIKEGS